MSGIAAVRPALERDPVLEAGLPGAWSAKRDEPLHRHTSMRVGGPADLFCVVESEVGLATVVRAAAERGWPIFLLGSGTNIVIGDGGMRGVTVKLGRGLAERTWRDEGDGVHLAVGAAANLRKVVLETIDRGLTGLEFAEGIPGSVGGGVIMNAGAFGGELSDVAVAVRGVDAEGRCVRLAREELRFSYRHLELPRGFVVTGLEVKLVPGEAAEIAARADRAKRKRNAHQPAGFPNAGSIFKNPRGDFAGRLIEKSGLKGQSIGGAMVSPDHANFIVNAGGATAAQVRDLMYSVRDRVWEQRGVWLEPEVRFLGEF